MNATQRHQWARFQVGGPRDSAPIGFAIFLASGLALAGAVLMLTIEAYL